MNADPRHRVHSTCLLIPLLLVSGCATMGSEFDTLLAGMAGDQAQAQPAIPPGAPTATVVMIANGESPVSAPLDISEVTYIQNALDKTGLNNRFARMDIALYRPLEFGNHRLSIEYDRTRRQVVSSYDYSLRPGDRLVVTEDTSTVLDDMLGSLSGPFK